MHTTSNMIIDGFIFGAVGLYIIAALALIFAPIEYVGNILFYPGRMLASQFVGSQGSNGQVLLLTMANGLLYSALFWIVGSVYVRLTDRTR